MHVTGLTWCDFFVWTPVGEPFLQRIVYDTTFMNAALSKAKLFYFDKFLPAIASYFIVHTSVLCSSVTPFNPGQLKPDYSKDHEHLKHSTIKVSMKLGSQIFNDKSKASKTETVLKSQKHEDHGKVKVDTKNHDKAAEDLQLVAVYTKPPSCSQNLQTLLEYLQLRRHSVRGDGSCLYHTVAH